MYIVIFCSILALLLTELESNGLLKGAMKWGFFIVTLLGCIHYNYGNDYKAYHNVYNTIVSIPFDWGLLISGHIYKEPGWAILCYIFEDIGGFFMMVAVLNIVQNVIIYKAIKNNVNRRWWTLSIFIYLFSTSFYLLNFSMMRQGLVVCLFLGVWEAIKHKRFLISLIILLLCYTIHNSAIILLPVLLACFVKIKNGRIATLMFILTYILLWFKGGFINEILSLFLFVDDIADYAVSYGEEFNSNTYGIGFILNLIPFILSLIYIADRSRVQEHSDKLAVAISIMCFIIAPFTEVIPLIGRVGMYFGVYQIIAIPKIYSNVATPILRIPLLTVFCIMLIYNYMKFFNSPVFHDSYSTFHTIFSAI